MKVEYYGTHLYNEIYYIGDEILTNGQYEIKLYERHKIWELYNLLKINKNYKICQIIRYKLPKKHYKIMFYDKISVKGGENNMHETTN